MSDNTNETHASTEDGLDINERSENENDEPSEDEDNIDDIQGKDSIDDN